MAAERQLIERVASGVAWSVAEKLGSMALQMVVSIVVARLLLPEDFGVLAILTFFTASPIDFSKISPIAAANWS